MLPGGTVIPGSVTTVNPPFFWNHSATPLAKTRL